MKISDARKLKGGSGKVQSLRNVQAISSLDWHGTNKNHGIVSDDKGEEQPKDKQRAQQPGVQEKKDAAKQPESPGQPAGGE